MKYRKISDELIVFPEHEVATNAEISSTLDTPEEKYSIFGGAVETASVDRSGSRRKTALRQTIDASNAAVSAIKSAAEPGVKHRPVPRAPSVEISQKRPGPIARSGRDGGNGRAWQKTSSLSLGPFGDQSQSPALRLVKFQIA